MKRFLSVMMVLVLVLSLSAGCGGSGGSSGGNTASPTAEGEGLDLDSLKTMGDVLALEGRENEGTGFSEKTYGYGFELDGMWYRVIVDLPEDVSKALWELDYEDPEYDEKMAALISPLEIKSAENLSANIPTQEEVDKYVGKTGQDLIDEGFTGNGYNLDNMEFWMSLGPYLYTVVFDTDEKYENTDDFNEYEVIGPLKIKSITCTGVGDASYFEEEETEE